ncbi:Hypothetical predicted protein [Octopus vulgaris]|uniref:Uncharacterized protein n=1 Tax=Octopus vulgaris TaxID=6645 RepID=A0AA36BQP6_OCTVU|nr:Hypothetical predicted protein [Octopus vulgaris]
MEMHSTAAFEVNMAEVISIDETLPFRRNTDKVLNDVVNILTMVKVPRPKRVSLCSGEEAVVNQHRLANKQD